MESFNEKVERLLYTLTYNQILEIDNLVLREVLLKRYDEEKDEILANFPGLEKYFNYSRSLGHNYEYIKSIYNESISEYLFPGDKVIYFPIIESFRASKMYTCAVSGAVINPGSYYEQFKAILNNISQNKSFVSPKIRYEIGNFTAPASLHEFENFYYRLEHSYELDLKEEYNIFCNMSGMQLKRIRYKNQKPKK